MQILAFGVSLVLVAHDPQKSQEHKDAEKTKLTRMLYSFYTICLVIVTAIATGLIYQIYAIISFKDNNSFELMKDVGFA
jgi:hypothetical protein